MSQVRYAFSGSTFVKMALGLAAAVAAMFALMGATSNPAQANPPASGCAPGVVVVCNNPISIIGGDVNVITENEVLEGAHITIVKNVLNAKCGGIINVSCLDVSLKALNVLITNPKIISIVKI